MHNIDKFTVHGTGERKVEVGITVWGKASWLALLVGVRVVIGLALGFGVRVSDRVGVRVGG